MQEPLLTWNLFLTAFIVPLSIFLLGVWMNRSFKKRDAKDEEIRKLRGSIENRRETNLCAIKKCLEEIKDKLNSKVSHEDCIREHKEVWDGINDLRGRFYRTPFSGSGQ